MQICCTKDLQNELGITAEGGSEENDLFCWSTHIITINRRKAVVAVNDSNRFGFVLYGLKAKELKNLKDLLLNGIRKCLEDEKIKKEVIDKYLETAGDIDFVKTRGAKYVGRLNKACEILRVFSDKINPTEIYQTEIAEHINHDFVKINKQADYEYPHDLLLKDLESLVGENIIDCKAVDLVIKLNLGRYKVWRKIITPIDSTFKQLHNMIQITFDWKNYHLYSFNVFDQSGKCMAAIISKEEEIYESNGDCKLFIDSEVRLSDYIDEQYRMVYCYDYGDNWIHEITVGKIIDDYDKNYPVCLIGEGNTPPEDVGGAPGYMEFLDIILDKNHEDYRHMNQWAQSQGYKDFDIMQINRRLVNVLRWLWT